MVESGLANAEEWASLVYSKPWRLQFHFNEIKELSSQLDVGIFLVML